MEVLAIPWISINGFLEKFASKTWEEATVLNQFRMLRGQSSWSGAQWPVLTLVLTFSQQSPHSLGCLFFFHELGWQPPPYITRGSEQQHNYSALTREWPLTSQRHWNTSMPPGSPLNIHEHGLCFSSPSLWYEHHTTTEDKIPWCHMFHECNWMCGIVFWYTKIKD